MTRSNSMNKKVWALSFLFLLASASAFADECSLLQKEYRELKSELKEVKDEALKRSLENDIKNVLSEIEEACPHIGPRS